MPVLRSNRIWQRLVLQRCETLTGYQSSFDTNSAVSDNLQGMVIVQVARGWVVMLGTAQQDYL